jgi:hypothetical protein
MKLTDMMAALGASSGSLGRKAYHSSSCWKSQTNSSGQMRQIRRSKSWKPSSRRPRSWCPGALRDHATLHHRVHPNGQHGPSGRATWRRSILSRLETCLLRQWGPIWQQNQVLATPEDVVRSPHHLAQAATLLPITQDQVFMRHGTPGSPPTRLTAIPDKWVRPTRRPADLSVGPTDLVGSPHDLLMTFQKIP